MIARNREITAGRPVRREMVEAHRTVASALFRRRSEVPTEPARPASRAAVWIFLAWTMAVVASYFVFGSWWSVPMR